MKIPLLAGVGFAGLLLHGAALHAQQPSVPVAATHDDDGFVPMFDGKTLAGWEGDPVYWRVENGAIVGETTAQAPLRQNSFITWKGGSPKNFELKVEYRITASGNSGVNYRSTMFPDVPFAMKGYQFDIDGETRNTGDTRHTANTYEERGRTFLARRGDVTRLLDGSVPQIIASVGVYKELGTFIKNGDWNQVHIIARGHTLIHILNGHVMTIVEDDDEKGRRDDGLIGVQVHVGAPMKVEYRNFRLKDLDAPAAVPASQAAASPVKN